MRATTVEQIQVQPRGAGRMHRQEARHECPDVRWPPAVRLLVLVGLCALSWTAVILLSSLLFA
jgi:hypothetical protein